MQNTPYTHLPRGSGSVPFFDAAVGVWLCVIAYYLVLSRNFASYVLSNQAVLKFAVFKVNLKPWNNVWF